MKKIVFLVLMVFSLGVFAASVDLSGAGSVKFNPAPNQDNKFVIGQTDLAFAAANKDIAVTWIVNLEENLLTAWSLTPVTKYAWVSGKILGGNGQAGLINPIINTKMAGGFYGDSVFSSTSLMNINLRGAGFSYATGPWTVAYTGAANLLSDGSATSTEGKLGVAYAVKEINGKVALIMNQDQSDPSFGYDIYAEGSQAFGALTVAGQAIFGLSDMSGAKKLVCAVYLNYMLDKAQDVYFNYIEDIENDTCKQYNAGYTYSLSDSTKAIVDYSNDLLSDGDEVFTVGLNFNI